jgi:CspA family cold shock protein
VERSPRSTPHTPLLQACRFETLAHSGYSARPDHDPYSRTATNLIVNVSKVNYLKLFHYLHFIVGLTALIIGLVNALPFFTQQGPIDHMGILLLLTGLLNLQQFNSNSEFHSAPKRAASMVASVLILLAALIPLFATLISPALAGFGIHAIGLAIGGVCLLTILTLTGKLSKVSFSMPSMPGKSMLNKSSDREAGTVKWFNTNKGFGFISRDQGDDVFVHFRAIRGEGHRALAEGQRVEFVVANRDKGLQAEDVVIL